jgi:hypothetical protein
MKMSSSDRDVQQDLIARLDSGLDQLKPSDLVLVETILDAFEEIPDDTPLLQHQVVRDFYTIVESISLSEGEMSKLASYLEDGSSGFLKVSPDKIQAMLDAIHSLPKTVQKAVALLEENNISVTFPKTDELDEESADLALARFAETDSL